ncbi:MAG: fatty acid CoA ligase family protein [Gemmatimonadales bacterium]
MPPDTTGNFAATLSAVALADPGRTALIEPVRASRWRQVNFVELDVLANRYAIGLRRHGVRRGDRVLYLLRPSVDAFAVFYALLRLGAVPAFVDPLIGIARLRACVRAVRPAVVIGVPEVHLIRLIARTAFECVRLLITSGRGSLLGGESLRSCLAAAGDFVPEAVKSEDECYLPFTSGSTGPPKGVFCTHGMVDAQSELVRDVCDWRGGMRIVMCYAPFVPFALADGLTVILPAIDFTRPAAAAPERIVAAVSAHHADCAFASPIVWMQLARYCESERISLPTLRRAVAAGAPVQADLHRRLLAVMHPEGQLYTPYGATEAMPITTASSSALAGTWQQTRTGAGTCVGAPLRGTEVLVIRVTDEAIATWSDDLALTRGAIGELVVGGDMVSPAYFDDAAQTTLAKIDRGGRVLHRTGDLGCIDGEGRVWFCGRKSHRIETREGMLAPVPIENVLNEHPDVFRTAAVGVGAKGQQQVVACVEMEEGRRFTPVLEAELTALADATCFKGVIARFLPHHGFPVDPRHNSKIKRDELAVWATGRLAARVSSR